MKLFLFFLFIGTTLAYPISQDHRDNEMAETLINRARSLVEKAKHVIDENEQQHEDLLSSIKNLKDQVKTLSDEFERKYQGLDLTKNEIHTMSEDLLHLENRLTEEFIIFYDHIEHDDDDDNNVDHLIKRAEDLIKKAHDEIRQFNPDYRTRAVVQFEIAAVMKLVEVIRHGDEEQRQKYIPQLKSQLRSLEIVLEKIRK
ncbi:uncharacterized protein LOC113795120 [Dermatophagoides pteronyssinus]|uniref:uncharacterized protein LOC113795120 n=1 Tax=Dermatophagoides pteronyssinus TaxID=6956 RepID=UPI003F670F6B